MPTSQFVTISLWRKKEGTLFKDAFNNYILCDVTILTEV